MDERLREILSRRFAAIRQLEREAARDALRKVREETAPERLRTGFFGRALDEAAAKQLRVRAEGGVAEVTRIVEARGLRWTHDLGQAMTSFLREKLGNDAHELRHIANEFFEDGLAIGSAVNDAEPRVAEWIASEIELLVLAGESKGSSADDPQVDDARGFMLRAIEQARASNSEPGRVSPKVGAVLVRDGRVIAEAHRGEMEVGEHAEYTLLERKLADDTVAGATLFTTLEPCTSRNTPKIPCVERIIERRLDRVYIGMLDPNDDIRGRGELRLRDAGVEVARFDSDLMAVIEELNRDFIRLHRQEPPISRTEAQLRDPVPEGEAGPNGFPIGYTDDGDKVEWVSDPGDPNGPWPLLLRRGDSAIKAAYDELWHKVWYNRHRGLMAAIARGEYTVGPEQEEIIRQAREKARALEDEYGAENLRWDDFEWGLLSGRMSALAWVLGMDWPESLDT
jgi:pyrimidine deaminase RibD-like protein